MLIKNINQYITHYKEQGLLLWLIHVSYRIPFLFVVYIGVSVVLYKLLNIKPLLGEISNLWMFAYLSISIITSLSYVIKRIDENWNNSNSNLKFLLGVLFSIFMYGSTNDLFNNISNLLKISPESVGFSLVYLIPYNAIYSLGGFFSNNLPLIIMPIVFVLILFPHLIDIIISVFNSTPISNSDKENHKRDKECSMNIIFFVFVTMIIYLMNSGRYDETINNVLKNEFINHDCKNIESKSVLYLDPAHREVLVRQVVDNKVIYYRDICKYETILVEVKTDKELINPTWGLSDNKFRNKYTSRK